MNFGLIADANGDSLGEALVSLHIGTMKHPFRSERVNLSPEQDRPHPEVQPAIERLPEATSPRAGKLRVSSRFILPAPLPARVQRRYTRAAWAN